MNEFKDLNPKHKQFSIINKEVDVYEITNKGDLIPLNFPELLSKNDSPIINTNKILKKNINPEPKTKTPIKDNTKALKPEQSDLLSSKNEKPLALLSPPIIFDKDFDKKIVFCFLINLSLNKYPYLFVF